jgi:ATP-dependent DNA helicase
MYHGSKEERQEKRRKINKRYHIHTDVWVQPVVVTSYEICMNDRKYLGVHEWRYLVVDEGHRIKNSQCRLIKYEINFYIN